MLRSYASEMDKQQDLVQEAVKEQHNTTSNELDLEPQKLYHEIETCNFYKNSCI